MNNITKPDSYQLYGNNGLRINWTYPRLPHHLAPHTGKVIKMPYGGYGYGLHVWIGTNQRLPIVPASGRKQEYIVPDNPHIDMRVRVPTGNRQQKRRQRKTPSSADL